jgi:hypothetical protein
MALALVVGQFIGDIKVYQQQEMKYSLFVAEEEHKCL